MRIVSQECLTFGGDDPLWFFVRTCFGDEVAFSEAVECTGESVLC